MTDSKFDLAATLETLRSSDRTVLDKLLLEFAESGNVEAVDALLKGGAAINARDKDGRSALHLAAGRGEIRLVGLLIAKRAIINAKDHNDWTALH